MIAANAYRLGHILWILTSEMKSVKALFNQLADKLFRGFYYEMLLMHKSQVAH